MKNNELYENYYNGLGIVPENEREQFWDALRRPLPSSFRFTGSKRFANPDDLMVFQMPITLFVSNRVRDQKRLRRPRTSKRLLYP